jgi:hypothetical protein
LRSPVVSAAGKLKVAVTTCPLRVSPVPTNAPMRAWFGITLVPGGGGREAALSWNATTTPVWPWLALAGVTVVIPLVMVWSAAAPSAHAPNSQPIRMR